MVTNCNDVMATGNEIRWNCYLRRRVSDAHTELNEPFQIVSVNSFRIEWHPTFEWQNPSWCIKISNDHAIKGENHCGQIHLLINENEFDKISSKFSAFFLHIPVDAIYLFIMIGNCIKKKMNMIQIKHQNKNTYCCRPILVGKDAIALLFSFLNRHR